MLNIKLDGIMSGHISSYTRLYILISNRVQTNKLRHGWIRGEALKHPGHTFLAFPSLDRFLGI